MRDTSVNKLEDQYELKASSALHQNVNMALADSLHSGHSARGEGSSANSEFCHKSIQNSL